MFRPFRGRLGAIRHAVPALICCLALGCGEKIYRVSGKATFAGKPIPVGKIYFTPDAAKGNSGPSGYATIKDGQYDTATGGGQGILGGPMVVRIEGADGVKIDEERPNGKPLFAHYETQLEMPKSTTTKDFDVPASAVNQKPGGGPVIVP